MQLPKRIPCGSEGPHEVLHRRYGRYLPVRHTGEINEDNIEEFVEYLNTLPNFYLQVRTGDYYIEDVKSVILARDGLAKTQSSPYAIIMKTQFELGITIDGLVYKNSPRYKRLEKKTDPSLLNQEYTLPIKIGEWCNYVLWAPHNKGPRDYGLLNRFI